MYRLKKGIENFQVMSGPFEGRKFEQGKRYKSDHIPPEENKKFEKVKEQKSENVKKAEPEKTSKETAGSET